MSTTRLEAFSDGVIAVIITIMVLELKVPHGSDFLALRTLVPTFTAYVLSFIYVGIYWNNHHHMFQVVQRLDGRSLWANLHLLFWLSLIPFSTAWLGENIGAPIPTAVYGALLLASAIAFTVLATTLVACNGADSPLARALADDRKTKISIACYAIGTIVAFAVPYVAYVLYFIVATIWFVPDRRVEKVIEEDPQSVQPQDATRPS